MNGAVNITTGLGPRGLAAADMDGDGKPDLAVACELGNVVTLFRNISSTSTVSFTAASPFTAATAPYSVALADLDADGKNDMAVAGGTTLGVFRSTSTTGNISFAARTDYTSSNTVYHVTVGDINGDTKPDVLITRDNSHGAYQNLSSTPGSIVLSSPAFLILGLGAGFASELIDLDGDAMPDVAKAMFTSDRITMSRNIITLPKVTSFSPSPAAAGATISIFGLGLDNATAVSFGGIPAVSFTVVSSNQIDAVLGAGNSGDVSVTTPFGTSALSGFVFAGPPAITGFTPTAAGLGQTVTISGTNLKGDGSVSVRFGGIPANSLTSVEPNTIVAVVDAGNTGDVSVTTAYGTATLPGFTYLPLPTITGFTPSTAATGNTVTITGTNLSGTTAVGFGGVAATSFAVVSAIEITAVVGAGASGDIVVTTNFGTTTASGFVYIQPPVISGFTPGSAQTGTAITITGQNFDNATAVSFGGQAADSFTVVSPTTITAWVSGGATGSVTVTTPGGSNSLGGFTFIPPVQVTSIVPDYGTAGSSFVINGSGFNPTVSGNKVSVGSIAATVNSATATAISVTAPAVATAKQVYVLTNDLTASSTKPFRTAFTAPSPAFTQSSFGPAVKLNGGRDGYYIASSDLDGDGRLDIISPDIISKQIAILRNNGNGGTFSFEPRIMVDCYWLPHNVLAADMDGDGKPELVWCNGSNADMLSVCRNTSSPGNISFAARVDIPMELSGFPTVALGDLDIDGRIDIAIRTSSANDSVVVIKNKCRPGIISLAQPKRFFTGFSGASLNAILIHDMDNDGKEDIILGAPVLEVLRNTSTPGNLSFAGTPTGIAATQVANVTLGDIDNDGKTDIACSAGGLYVYKNQSTPGNISFSSTLLYTPNFNINDVEMGDLNGDGKAEITILEAPNVNEYAVFENLCTSSTVAFAARVRYQHPTAPFSFSFCDIGDLNGDNKLDLLMAYSGADSLLIAPNTMGDALLQLCSNASTGITSNLTGTNYQWQQDNGSGFVNLNDNGTFSGTHTVSLQLLNVPVSFNGYKYRCYVDNSNYSSVTTLIVNPTPIASAGQDTAICFNGTATLHGSGGTVYSWSGGTGLNNYNIANPLASPGSTTIYTLTVSNGNNCYSTDDVVVTVIPIVTPSVNISMPVGFICASDGFTFTAFPVNGGSNPSYQWKLNGANAGTNSNTYSGYDFANADQVQVFMSSSLACISGTPVPSNTVTLQVNSLDTPVLSRSGNDFTVTNPDPAAVYHWQVLESNGWSDIVPPPPNGTSYTATHDGEFRVVGSKGVCHIPSASILLSRPSTQRDNEYGIFAYPNPATHTVRLDSIPLSQNWETLEILCATGSRCMPAINIRNKSNITIDITALQSGVYFARLRRTDGTFTTLRFVKI